MKSHWAIWTSCAQMLPPPGKRYLVWYTAPFGRSDSNFSALRMTADGPVWDIEVGFWCLKKVTHWAPEPLGPGEYQEPTTAATTQKN